MTEPDARDRYVEVAVPLPVEGRFHYRVPDELQDSLQPGHRVLVQFGPRQITGFVLGTTDEVDESLKPKIKPVLERLDQEPLIPPDVLALARFAADYYLAPIGEVLKVALPPGLTSASKLKLVLTAEGRSLLNGSEARLPTGERISDAQRLILEAAKKSSGVKGKQARSKAARELRALGLIADAGQLKARRGSGDVEIVERRMVPRDAWPLIARAPARKRLYELLADGPRAVAELKELLGRTSLKRSLDRLVADEIVQLRAVPKTEWAGRAGGSVASSGHLTLSDEQGTALAQILEAYEAKQASTFLLHGVTGSGKTEVYLQAIARVRAQGVGAIVLVPEIALTPQLENRFRARFGDDVVVLHSGIADGERRRRWRALRDGEAQIALGPRSALWAPVRDLRMVVVDEEHDPSFKQNADVRYHGRDLALMRAHQTGSVAVLGSATPSLETLHAARSGRMTELVLSARVGATMPRVEIVDLSEERRKTKDVSLISRVMEDGLREVVQKKEQAILFLNRRGFNTIVHCDECGDARTCSRCDVSLTHHKSSGMLHCHYCDHEEPMRTPCRKCKGTAMKAFGAGTERVAELVESVVPDVRVIRLDRDTTQRVGALDDVLASFRAGEADVMVGTQMVAKGHDFPNVTFVGILLADASLAFPDFRAAERTFQLMTQVAGRAGRAERPGRVVVQTFQPHHYALEAALSHDTNAFFDIERRGREEARYPPYTRLGVIRIESRHQRAAEGVALRVARAGEAASAQDETLRVRGPAPAPLARLRDRFRYVVLLFADSPARLRNAMTRTRHALGDTPNQVDLIYDVDAIDLL